MRVGLAPVVLAAAVALSGCELITTALPGSLECGGTELAVCQAVARIAIAQINLQATGRIMTVVLEPIPDCGRWAHSNFMGDWSDATACWNVTVTGERSHGWGAVVMWPDGSFEPFW